MENNITKQGLSIREICYIGIFVAIMAVCAQVSIPFPGGVPFTLQTWAVYLAGVILGAKKGTIAVLVYILLGAMGVPVFTQFRSGLGTLFGATGGFIMSFPIMAFIAGTARNRNHIALLIAGLILGVFVNLSLGMLWFANVTENSLQAAFSAAVAPFIPAEIFKIATVPIIGKKT